LLLKSAKNLNRVVRKLLIEPVSKSPLGFETGGLLGRGNFIRVKVWLVFLIISPGGEI
jgi:hypothetical protein